MYSEQKGRSLDINLHLITSTITGASTLDEILGALLDFVTRLDSCAECVAYVRLGAELVRWQRKRSNFQRSGVWINPELSAALSRYRAPIAVDRTSGATKFKVFDHWSGSPGEVFICVPLVCRSQVVGAITINHRQGRAYSPSEIALLSTAGYLVAAAVRTSQLQDQNSTLRLELETQKLVARGKGILQRDLGMSEHEAYLALQRQSEEKKRSMKEIAQAIILGAEIRNDAVHAI